MGPTVSGLSSSEGTIIYCHMPSADKIPDSVTELKGTAEDGRQEGPSYGKETSNKLFSSNIVVRQMFNVDSYLVRMRMWMNKEEKRRGYCDVLSTHS